MSASEVKRWINQVGNRATKAVMTIPRGIAVAKACSTVRRHLSRLPSPKYSAATTVTPMAKPLNRDIGVGNPPAHPLGGNLQRGKPAHHGGGHQRSGGGQNVF